RPRAGAASRLAAPRPGTGRRAGCRTPIVSQWRPPRAVSDSRPAGPRHGNGRRAGCLTPIVSHWLPPRAVSDSRPAGPRHGDGRRAGCVLRIVWLWPPPRAVSDSRPAGPRHGDGRRAGCLTPVVSRWLPSLQPGAWRLDIMQCRFEDRLAGRALSLRGRPQRIEARRPDELPAALDAIEAARHAGHWVALLLDYELGEWLAPETTLPPPGGRPVAPRGEDGAPRLVALVAGHMAREAPWPAPADPGSARIESLQPRMARADYLRQIEAIRALIAA